MTLQSRDGTLAETIMYVGKDVLCVSHYHLGSLHINLYNDQYRKQSGFTRRAFDLKKQGISLYELQSERS